MSQPFKNNDLVAAFAATEITKAMPRQGTTPIASRPIRPASEKSTFH